MRSNIERIDQRTHFSTRRHFAKKEVFCTIRFWRDPFEKNVWKDARTVPAGRVSLPKIAIEEHIDRRIGTTNPESRRYGHRLQQPQTMSQI
tara:strand:- start:2819 stop:3091 length:273 start_codon:yes stop_codon:yes gene_type:complete